MDSVFPFLRLPREIRDQIYGLCANWNTALWALVKQPRQRWKSEPPLSTPTILQLNHQITAEALEILEKEPLRLDILKNGLNNGVILPNIYSFFSFDTLLRIPRLELHYIPDLANKLVDFLSHFHDDEGHPCSTKHIIIHLPSNGFTSTGSLSDELASTECALNCAGRPDCAHLNLICVVVRIPYHF